MHRLLTPPARQILDRPFRLPPVQEPNQAIAANLRDTLMDSDALRRIKTTARSRKLSGPVATPQQFTTPQGGVNQPPTMNAGSHKMNARRLTGKTRGQTAGTS